MTRRRQLSDEEEALWSRLARSIKPLRPGELKSRRKSEREAQPEPSAPIAAEKKTLPRSVAPAKPPAPAKSLPLAPLDRRTKQRLARGRDAIDARIDLHGMTQSQAHDALARFLRRAQSDGAKTVLIVTGKGVDRAAGRTSRDGFAERGVLRRQVPLWLALPEFRLFIVGFEEAHVSHGGQGALYVRLRRAR
jgi:DNA-nicking Smr family endonuclease